MSTIILSTGASFDSAEISEAAVYPKGSVVGRSKTDNDHIVEDKDRLAVTLKNGTKFQRLGENARKDAKILEGHNIPVLYRAIPKDSN